MGLQTYGVLDFLRGTIGVIQKLEPVGYFLRTDNVSIGTYWGNGLPTEVEPIPSVGYRQTRGRHGNVHAHIDGIHFRPSSVALVVVGYHGVAVEAVLGTIVDERDFLSGTDARRAGNDLSIAQNLHPAEAAERLAGVGLGGSDEMHGGLELSVGVGHSAQQPHRVGCFGV